MLWEALGAARDLGRFAFYSGFTYEPYAHDSWR